jgi:DNA-binding NtrC family response regulator
MRRILVVENERDLGAALCDLLGEEGFVVALTSGIEEARATFASFEPDVVLVDYLLDGETSEQWVEEIAGRAEVILMSASPTSRSLAERHSLPFVTKPFDIERLLQILV